MRSPITAADILSHPRFMQARSAHVDEIVKLFKGDHFAIRMMGDAGVIMLRGFLVGFYAAFDADDRATWATPGNLKRAVTRYGLASPRRVDDLLAHFRQDQLIESRPSPNDRRTLILVPAERVIAHDRAHLAAYHRFLLDLFPGRGYEWTLTRDETTHLAIRRAAIHDQPRATSTMDHAFMRLFLARDAGYLALLLVAQAQIAGRSGPSWSSMSDDLGVSRSHLRTLFVEAAAAGYIRLAEDGCRTVEILPALWTAHDCFLAGLAVDQDAITQTAMARLVAPSPANSTQI